MATVTISDEEKEALSHALEIYLTDLKEEVFKTDSREAKESLRREEEVIRGILKKLEAMKAGV
ncbi:MAG: hypothetical protein M0Z58_08325 [Nitrospiraceae bacterium]|nr:hypothetical protein [Nitrospiraceae bacterium]